jgi:hypothetical protein
MQGLSDQRWLRRCGYWKFIPAEFRVEVAACSKMAETAGFGYLRHTQSLTESDGLATLKSRRGAFLVPDPNGTAEMFFWNQGTAQSLIRLF